MIKCLINLALLVFSLDRSNTQHLSGVSEKGVEKASGILNKEINPQTPNGGLE